MFSLIPNGWQQPRVNKVHLSDELKNIKRPIKKAPRKISKPLSLHDLQKEIFELSIASRNADQPIITAQQQPEFLPSNYMPEREQCDFHADPELDMEISKIIGDSKETQSKVEVDRHTNMKNHVHHLSESLDANIKKLQDSPDENGVSKKELINLFESFKCYNKKVEEHLGAINPSSYMTMMVGDISVGMKLMDLKGSKIMLVQIPQEIFMKDGYKCVDNLIQMLKAMNIVCVAIPKSVDLINISESDLLKLDLVKMNNDRCDKM